MLRISPNKNPGARVEALIRAGAESLFTQHRHSIGYLLGGADDIVETNIVLHIGSAFLSQGHAVWAESPFKVDGEKSVKHLDLLIDLDPSLSDTASVLLVEAKRLRSLDGTETVEDVIKDCKRIEAWPDRLVGQKPIFFEFTQVECALGAVVVLLPDEQVTSPDDPAVPLFSEWWVSLEGYPAGFDKSCLDELKQLIQPMRRGICQSDFVNEDVHQVVVYALSRRDLEVEDKYLLTAKHEAAHVIVAQRLGLPGQSVSIEEYESPTDTALNGRMYCDWESLRGARDNSTLCIQAFAVAYAGVWLEAIVKGCSFSETYQDLPTDSRAATYIRQCLMQWDEVDMRSTEKESETGADLAKSIVENEMDRIDRLADHLADNRSMEEEEIAEWFAEDVALHG